MGWRRRDRHGLLGGCRSGASSRLLTTVSWTKPCLNEGCHSDSRVTSGRFLQPASSDGGICSAQAAAGADLSGPARELKKALAHNGPLGMTVFVIFLAIS